MGIYLLRTYVSFFFFSSRRRHTRFDCDWSSDVCSSDLLQTPTAPVIQAGGMHTAVQITLSFEIASMQLTPAFKIAALQLRPISKVVTKIGRASCRERV